MKKITEPKKDKLKLGQALLETVKDSSFRLLLSAYLTIVAGTLTSAALTLYVNIYYVFDGDKKLAAEVYALGGMFAVIGAYLGLRLANIISVRTGKKETLIAGLTLVLIAVGSMFFTMQPGFQVHEVWGFKYHPQVISFFFYGMGLQACWLLIDSMTADICDEDELRTGRRRRYDWCS